MCMKISKHAVGSCSRYIFYFVYFNRLGQFGVDFRHNRYDVLKIKNIVAWSSLVESKALDYE